MGEKYDYFTYNIIFKKHAFIYLVFKKKKRGEGKKGVKP